MSIPANQKALFLFDGPNFYKNLKSAGIERGHLDYRRLAQNLSKGRSIVDVLFFTSPVDQKTDAENYKNQQKFFAALTASGVSLRLGHLVSRRIPCVACKEKPMRCSTCGSEQIVKTEKSVDVQLALALLTGAVNDYYDVAYIASCDSDLVPAITMARSRGKQVFMLLPHGAKGYAVSESCDTTIPIKQETVDAAQVE